MGRKKVTKTLFLDAGWKRWVAENALRGAPAEELTRVLVERGFDEAHARLEVDTALAHPYVHAASSVVRQLQKRDWVLHNFRTLAAAGRAPVDEVWATIDAETFLQSYYSTNRPLVLHGALQPWPAIKKWSPEFLIEAAGEVEVEIQADRDADPEFEVHKTKHTTRRRFADFVNQVFDGNETNDVYMTAYNGNANREILNRLMNDILPLPSMLDEATVSGRTFFWMGPEGTVTPLHHDLTNNLMAQVVGRKRVKLIAPFELPLVYNHLHCFSRVDPENVDLSRFPLFKDVRVLDVTIGPGDILFLPVGWWHHVRGLDPTITITCTNFKYINHFTEHYHTTAEI